MFLFLALIYTFRSLTLMVAAVVGLRSLHAMSLLPWGNRNELTKPVTIFPLLPTSSQSSGEVLRGSWVKGGGTFLSLYHEVSSEQSTPSSIRD